MDYWCLKFLLCFLFIQVSVEAANPKVVHEKGRCIMYGECATNTGTSKNLNCFYNNKSKLLPAKDHDLLQEVCPMLYNGSETRTCCDSSQLTTIKSNIQVPYQAFSRCPTCYYNFVALFCEMTCGADQSIYTSPTAYQKGSGGNYVSFKNETFITQMYYNITTTFADNMFKSCQHVTNPSTNAPAINMLCGPNADKCTAEKWITYMNSVSNGFAPFEIDVNYLKPEDEGGAMDFHTIPCNESIPDGDGACSCNDCPASCSGPPPSPPPPVKPWLIFGIDGYYVVMTFVFGGLTFVYLYCNLTCYMYKSKNPKSLMKPGQLENGGVQLMPKIPDDPIPSDFVKLGMKLDRFMHNIFSRWGTFCASHPFWVILVGIIFVAVCTSGLVKMQITTDPVELWSAPESTARLQKNYFDSHFGPFYRTEQLIIVAKNATGMTYSPYTSSTDPKDITYVHFGPILGYKEILEQILELQLAVENLEAYYPAENRNITLKDICFKPLEPYNQNCAIMSPLNYFQNNLTRLNQIVKGDFGIEADFHDHFISCTNGPTAVDDATALHLSCLGTYGGPIFPWVALGGFDGNTYLNATAAVITFSVNNIFDDPLKLGRALAWEKVYLEFMKNYTNENLTIAFSAERSIEDEINRESGADMITIAVSYIIMFAYVAIFLGKFSTLQLGRLMIEFKLTVGLCGVLIVLCSVGVSLGIFSYAGIPMTLIIVEVVPFLVLAVGVDNIFILVQHYQRDERDPRESTEQQIGRILGDVAPSMLMSSLSESLAFFLGGLSTMPAVRTFSLFAGLAVLTDFLLQMTCFVAVLALDVKRENSNRLDCCCCVKDTSSSPENNEGLLHKIMRCVVAPLVLWDYVRPFLFIFFMGTACFSGAVLHKVEVGLDQSLSMPSDSYVLDYFNGINNYLAVGAPVYFVVPEGYDYKTVNGSNKICGGNGCADDSLIQKLSVAAQMPNYSTIAYQASSWLDDYFSWLKPQSSCCRYYNDDADEFCNATITSSVANCTNCRSMTQVSENPRPTEEEFMEFLPWFLTDVPGIKCSKGGHAAYGSGVKIINKTNEDDKNLTTDVGATYFMTYHTVAKTSSDFIACLKQANALADNITASLNSSVAVFPYSIFYVYYEQYLTIVHDTIFNLGISIFVIFIIVLLMMGLDILSALNVVFTISLIVLNMFGVMYLWSIPLNAVSLVNLVMAVGISVEFCAHITRAFALSGQPTRLLRSKEALSEMGSSVLSGITLTKFVGITVLAFSTSQIFRVFYFRMYLSIVLLGATHGLIFLPILLSYIGPPRRPFSPNQKHQILKEEQDGHIQDDMTGGEGSNAHVQS